MGDFIHEQIIPHQAERILLVIPRQVEKPLVAGEHQKQPVDIFQRDRSVQFKIVATDRNHAHSISMIKDISQMISMLSLRHLRVAGSNSFKSTNCGGCRKLVGSME
ncbi:hypothetical protein BA011_33870 (plasmid) [Rhizobium leguminosarum]|uniref:Uncharacterized protein n=2 Tax=Rhizobium/Agrobacterium group TaxID=227290 RepID=A0A1B1CMA8_RHILE|nr:hypothetical protein BA011_33870 [Rhizobium leguminosarum]